ncbi:MAG: pyridoxal phosphate-dependent aminotransferase [Hyphomicrobium sp.]
MPQPPPFATTISSLPRLTPFVGPEAMERARGRPFRARLGANESLFGPSPKALAAMREAASENWMYADPESHVLRTAIAAHHGVPIDCVVVGEGIDGLLGLTCKLFLEAGEPVVSTDGAYPTFNFHVQAHGGRLCLAAMRDDREDLCALADMARRMAAKLIYVSNPNSPMGTWHSGDALAAWIADLPSGMLLILDEAYCDTAPAGAAPPIDVANGQVLRYRTFSKAYGLAGARIGYAVGHPNVISAFEKVRNHYGVNRVGQLGALAAIKDQPYLAEAVVKIAEARRRIADIAADYGLHSIESAASFVAIDCGGDGAFAKAVLDGLIDRDVFVRKPTAVGLERCIRVSCGRPQDLDVLAEALPSALADARSKFHP